MKAKTMFELSKELETYKRGFIDQTRLIQKLEKEKETLNKTILSLNEEIDVLKRIRRY